MSQRTFFLLVILFGCWGTISENAAHAAEPSAGQWTAGAAVGVIGDTPDGTAFALNLNVERFFNSSISLGPLVQIANFTQIAASAQLKYWLDVRLPNPDATMNFQAGAGIIHAEDDSSYVVPLGIGVDLPLNRTVALTMTLLLNFTGLDAGLGSGVHLMPGITVGVRF
jgi:hypothetical protein